MLEDQDHEVGRGPVYMNLKMNTDENRSVPSVNRDETMHLDAWLFKGQDLFRAVETVATYHFGGLERRANHLITIIPRGS